MKQSLINITLVVKDYDEALSFFTNKLKFDIIEDTYIQAQSKRWLVISPPGLHQTRIVLGKAINTEQKKSIGQQAGGRVFLSLQTDDFWRDYEEMKKNGIHFIRQPKKMLYGTVAVFEDLYGNLWDLISYNNLQTSLL